MFDSVCARMPWRAVLYGEIAFVGVGVEIGLGRLPLAGLASRPLPRWGEWVRATLVAFDGVQCALEFFCEGAFCVEG